jgi:hypothetical protein
MNFNFEEALESLGADATFMIASEAQPPADYLFNTLLPERNEPGYTVKSADMTVRSTMPGLVGLDSPYPPTGITELSTFLQEVAKIANSTHLTEAALRRLQAIMMQRQIAGTLDNDYLVNEALNFLNKVIIQGHLDRAEWMRGQALVNGEIDWTFNQITYQVNYGVPKANFLPTRTGNDAWIGSTSQFWTDIRLLTSILRYNVRAFIVHPDTLWAILNNDANKAEVLRQDGFTNGINQVTLRRLIGNNERPSQDNRDTVTLIAYGGEGEIIDLVNPGQTITLPFMSSGKLLAVGNNNRSGYRVGEGSTEDLDESRSLGYTHIAPTVEGGGRPGRWAQLFTPENLPMQLHGRGVSNMLPVIEAPKKIAIASSDLS